MPEMIPDILSDRTVIDADFWLRAAQGSVRRYCRWHVAPLIVEEITCNGGQGRYLHLPTKHMTRLVQVKFYGEPTEARVRWSAEGMLELAHGCWPDGLGAIQVTIEHGYRAEEVPEVASLIATLAQRASTSRAGIATQSVNGASVGYATASGAPISIPLLGIEKEALAPYRLDWWPR